MDVFFALLISFAGLIHLCLINDKRRRVFQQPAYTGPRYVIAARLALFGPGLVFALAGDAAGFVIWLGTVSVIGWAIVAIVPAQWAYIAKTVKTLPHWLRQGWVFWCDAWR